MTQSECLAWTLVDADFASAIALYRDPVVDGPPPDQDAARERFPRILEHPGASIWAAIIDDNEASMADST